MSYVVGFLSCPTSCHIERHVSKRKLSLDTAFARDFLNINNYQLLSNKVTIRFRESLCFCGCDLLNTRTSHIKAFKMISTSNSLLHLE